MSHKDEGRQLLLKDNKQQLSLSIVVGQQRLWNLLVCFFFFAIFLILSSQTSKWVAVVTQRRSQWSEGIRTPTNKITYWLFKKASGKQRQGSKFLSHNPIIKGKSQNSRKLRAVSLERICVQFDVACFDCSLGRIDDFWQFSEAVRLMNSSFCFNTFSVWAVSPFSR